MRLMRDGAVRWCCCVAAVVQCTQGSGGIKQGGSPGRPGSAVWFGQPCKCKGPTIVVASPHSCQQCRCTAHKQAIPACLHPAVRRGGRRHEGNLADARTQPNNVRPPQKIVEGSARGQCPAVLYEREGSRGQQDCGRAEKKGGQKQQEEGRAERGNQEEVAAEEKESS